MPNLPHPPARGFKVGVLLVHGLNGSTHDMAELAELLALAGLETHNLLLPGHGTHVRDMIPLGWPEWAGAVQQEVSILKQRCDLVFLVGHCLGAALCLHTAAYEEVSGVVAMCTPLHMRPWMLPLIRLAKYVTPVVPTLREDVRDPEARKRYTRDVYRWTPMTPTESLLTFLPHLCAELPQVTAPLLLMNAVHDHVVPVRDGQAIYRLIGSREKELVTFHRSYHVIMKDYDRREVFARTLVFVQRVINANRRQNDSVCRKSF